MLLEMLLVIAVLGVISTWSLPTCSRLIYMFNGKICMRTVSRALNYARSVAVLNQNIVIVCGSYDGLRCSGNWQHGILVLGNPTQHRYFHIPGSANYLLTLQQSGNSNKQVQIHPDAMTYTNGHFTYISLKASEYPPFKLYFNRALRIYITIGV